LITKVIIRNFKSIPECRVELDHLTVFVGPNGAGKSNFLDALSFVADSLREGIEAALALRSGIKAVKRISTGRSTIISITLEMNLKNVGIAEYAFDLRYKDGSFEIASEKCKVNRFNGVISEFLVQEGRFLKEVEGIKPQIQPDRLALYAASATAEFREVYDYLTSMFFYSIEPAKMQKRQKFDKGLYLKKDGSNSAAILKKIIEGPDKTGYNEICEVLKKIMPGLEKIEYQPRDDEEAIVFRQEVKGAAHPWRFEAHNMSDGTIRVLGLLLALYQTNKTEVIGIEEPEATVHPAVTDLLMDVINAASIKTQVIITTHSPEVLDSPVIRPDQIRVVESEKGNTIIEKLREDTKEVVRRRLYSLGNLLRIGELNASKTSPLFQNGDDKNSTNS
jgi:predicted ATPase